MKDARGHVGSLDGSNITFGYPNMINSQNLMSSKQVRLKSCCNFLYLCVFLSSYALKNSNISYRCNWIRIILTWEIRSESIACDRLCSMHKKQIWTIDVKYFLCRKNEIILCNHPVRMHSVSSPFAKYLLQCSP